MYHFASCLRIPYFRGVFSKDELPKNIRKNETGIVNLDNSYGSGTHWICYKKLDDIVYYFDSLGNLPPPRELINYFGAVSNVFYNYKRMQDINSTICGHLCLEFLTAKVSRL